MKAAASLWFTCALGSALLMTACASSPPGALNIENVQTLPATVEAVDLQQRLVRLRTQDGRTAVVEVAPTVSSLSRVKPGESVMVRYYQSLAAQLKKKGKRSTDDAVVHAPDDAAEGQGRSALTSTVVIDSVDRTLNTITFRGSNGKLRTVPIQTPGGKEFVARLKKGDEVEVTFKESFAFSVVPTT